MHDERYEYCLVPAFLQLFGGGGGVVYIFKNAVTAGTKQYPSLLEQDASFRYSCKLYRGAYWILG